MNGSGEIKGAYPIKGGEVKLIVNGAGDLKVTQDEKAVKASETGSGDMLHAHYAKGEATGSGDLYLTTTEQLDALIVGSG